MIKRLSLITLLVLCHAKAAQDPEFSVSVNTNIAFGSSDINEALVANHAHDPNDEFTLQGIELGLHTKWSEYVRTSAIYNGFLDEDDNLAGEWEEYFIQLHNLPGGLEFKLGQVLSNTTSENAKHLHSWSFVNASLLTTRFMGDEGLITESGQLSWKFINTAQHKASIYTSFGNAIPHEGHGHGHGDEDDEHGHGHEDEDDEHHDEDEDHHDEDEDHHDEDEDHHDEDDHHDDEDGHDEDEHGDEIEGEEALLTDDIFTVGINGVYLHNDFHQLHYRAHYSQGTNGFGLDTVVYGGSVQYVWREKGLEKGGRFFSAGAEYVYRDYDFASEDGSVTGSTDETGVSVFAEYGFNENWSLAARYEHVGGSNLVGETPEITRTSIAGTYRFDVTDKISGHTRLQYDFDERDGQEDANTVWLQLQLSYGGDH